MRIVRKELLLVAIMCAVVLALLPGSASATAPPWGACGASTDSGKLVRQFAPTPRLNYYLRCGDSGYGYRHLVARHGFDFEQLAAGTYRNWRDVADLAMSSIAGDPDVAKPAGAGKACLSRVIFLKNLRTNQVVRQQVVPMIIDIASGNIITAYPHGRQCP